MGQRGARTQFILLVLIVMGSCIGSGIFMTPSSVAEAIPFAGLLLPVWILGGIIALSGVYLAEYVRYLAEGDTLTGPKSDSLKLAFGQDSIDISSRMLIAFLNHIGEQQSALTHLQSLSTNEPENAPFTALLQILITMKATERDFTMLTTAEKQALVSVSETDFQCGKQAKNILDWVDGGLTQKRVPADLKEKPMKMKVTPNQTFENAAGSAFVQIYPNPNSGKFTLEWSLQEGLHTNKIEFFALDGKRFAEFSLNPHMSGKQELDLSNLPDGLYFYRFTDGGRFVSTGKLRIQK